MILDAPKWCATFTCVLYGFQIKLARPLCEKEPVLPQGEEPVERKLGLKSVEDTGQSGQEDRENPKCRKPERHEGHLSLGNYSASPRLRVRFSHVAQRGRLVPREWVFLVWHFAERPNTGK